MGDYQRPYSGGQPNYIPQESYQNYAPPLRLAPLNSEAGPSSHMQQNQNLTGTHRQDESIQPPTPPVANAKPAKEPKGGASEFVKKLYRMLEDPKFNETVCWGYTGDSFVVKDMNAFTKEILPLHFKHSNFASFVRQLNKYDFHKVKNPEEGGSPYGEHTWEFKHPSFRSDMKASLEHIKRKAPATRKGTPTPKGKVDAGANALEFSQLQTQIEGLHRSQTVMSQHMHNLTSDYQSVIGEMMNFQRNMVAQDQLMQNLIQYLVTLEADQKAALDPPTESSAPFVPSSQAQKLISCYTEVARASYDQMADLSRRASLSGGSIPSMGLPPPGFGVLTGIGTSQSGSIHSDRDRDVKPSINHNNNNHNNNNHNNNHQSNGNNHDNNRYEDYNNHQQQQQQQQQQQHHQQQQQQQQQQYYSQSQQPPLPSPPISTTPNSLQSRKPAYVPGWAVPPRVLLVEDDAVCRKLSEKFLKIFGCEIDVAVDGVSAVNKMNLEKYDLVLMDIVMPNLDGVSATSLIRQFDPMTPIISMTSNSGPNEIMTYFSHGMNDILPKPFTKEGLLGMLEKHLIHLKVMQQMAEIPRALGFTDHQITDAVASSTVGEGGNVINPFSAMGISDEDYVEMLQGIALEKEGKRGLEVVQGNEREGKRARFQQVEDGNGNYDRESQREH